MRHCGRCEALDRAGTARLVEDHERCSCQSDADVRTCAAVVTLCNFEKDCAMALVRHGIRIAGWVVLLTLIGCGRSEPAKVVDQPASGEPVAATPALAEDPFAALPQQPKAAQPAPDTPDAAITRAIQGLRENRPEQAWDFLPASYQTDLENLIHDLADRMEPEVWSRGFEVGRKLVEVLRTRKALILKNPLVRANQQGMTPEEMGRNWDNLVMLLELLVNSDLADVEKVRTLKIKQFLATTGSQFTRQIQSMAQATPNNPLDRLFKATITTVQQDGDSAVVRIEVPGEPPRDSEYVRVEGKWLPKNLAESWPASMETARARIAKIDREQLRQRKEKTLAKLDAMERGIDQLAAAETPEQFNQLLFAVALPLFNRPSQPAATVGADEVLIEIDRELNPKEQDQTLESLEKLTDDPSLATTSMTVVRGRTVVKLAPVKDLQALADRISFGEVIQSDATTRTITVRMTEPAN